MAAHSGGASSQSRESVGGSSRTLSSQLVLHSLTRLADAVAEFFGPGFEVVIHDFSDLDASIIHIAGNVTGRRVGGPITDLGLAVLRQGQVPDALVGYPTRSPDGRRLRSTSVFLKDEAGTPFGCVCINVDVTQIRSGVRAGGTNGALQGELVETFADDPESVIAGIFSRLVGVAGKAVSDMSRQEKIHLVSKMEEAGAFCLRGAVSATAELLGITRTTVYAYLKASEKMREREEVRGESTG